MTGTSPLARYLTPTQTAKPQLRAPWGAMLHTSGRGVTFKAGARKRKPIDVAVETYLAYQNGIAGYPWGGPTYVIDHDGSITQLCPDEYLVWHGDDPDSAHHAAYFSGVWVHSVPAALVELWHKQWPGVPSPAHLYPSKAASADYVGIEMIPCGDGFGTPLRPGLLFTGAQHEAAVKLCQDLAARHAWPLGWAHTPRLVGHEDVQPMNRSDKAGGWDPGYLRPAPYFDFATVRQQI